MSPGVTGFLRRTVLAACALGYAASVPALAQQHASPPEPLAPEPLAPDPLTTDKPPYCQHLARKVQRLEEQVRRPHLEADREAKEGVRLCGIGLILSGVRHLRYAVIELEDEKSAH